MNPSNLMEFKKEAFENAIYELGNTTKNLFFYVFQKMSINGDRGKEILPHIEIPIEDYMIFLNEPITDENTKRVKTEVADDLKRLSNIIIVWDNSSKSTEQHIRRARFFRQCELLLDGYIGIELSNETMDVWKSKPSVFGL